MPHDFDLGSKCPRKSMDWIVGFVMVFGGIYLGGACWAIGWFHTGEVAGGGYVNESNWQSVQDPFRLYRLLLRSSG